MASKKSEGPFIVVGSQSGVSDLTNLTDGSGLNYVNFFKTRSALEKHLEANQASLKPFYVFEGISKVTFEHTMKFGAINAK